MLKERGKKHINEMVNKIKSSSVRNRVAFYRVAQINKWTLRYKHVVEWAFEIKFKLLLISLSGKTWL